MNVVWRHTCVFHYYFYFLYFFIQQKNTFVFCFQGALSAEEGIEKVKEVGGHAKNTYEGGKEVVDDAKEAVKGFKSPF